MKKQFLLLLLFASCVPAVKSNPEDTKQIGFHKIAGVDEFIMAGVGVYSCMVKADDGCLYILFLGNPGTAIHSQHSLTCNNPAHTAQP